MSLLARYLSSALDLSVVYSAPKSVSESLEKAGIRFALASDSETDFIDKCLSIGMNSDTIFKKSKTITVDGEKLTGIVRYSGNDKYGAAVVIKSNGVYYKSIDPIFENDNQPDYDIGETVDGYYYKGAKLLSYVGGGYYEAVFADGRTASIHANSMKPYLSGTSESPATARRNPNMDFAEEVADWIRESGLARVHGGDVSVGESKNGKKYKSIGFSYPRALDGEIQIYGPKFILVKFDFRGIPGSFTARSPEEFHELMTENFGSFIRDY